jgi:hypothetical protein
MGARQESLVCTIERTGEFEGGGWATSREGRVPTVQARALIEAVEESARAQESLMKSEPIDASAHNADHPFPPAALIVEIGGVGWRRVEFLSSREIGQAIWDRLCPGPRDE